MRAQARSRSIVLVGLLVALAGACQKSGDALLYVTVTASPVLSGVATLDVTVTKVADAAPRTAGPLHYPTANGGVAIGSIGETLTVVMPASVGPVTLTVVARGAGGDELGRGTSSRVVPQGGSITNVTVKLGSSEPPDGGADDGNPQGAAGAGAGGSEAGSGGAAGGAGAGGAGGTSGTAGTAGAGGNGGGTAGGGGNTGTGGVAGPCSAGDSMACNTGELGVCAAGVKTCQLAADQKSTAWGSCVQSVNAKPRDCTSGNDNDCNGEADNLETTFCQCALINSPRPCSTGLYGICMAGTQACVVAADKTTSAWGACTQVKPKGTETCANPGTDDDCDGVVDNVPSTVCNVGNGVGACANGGHTACNGTTQVCNPAVSAIGDTTSTAWHLNTAPNGSWDWNCDGVVTKQYPDTAPPPPTCTAPSAAACTAVPQLNYALNPFACGDLGDIGSEYCIWLPAIPGCTNKTGQSTGYQQGCR
jgi:hypothetical protein